MLRIVPVIVSLFVVLSGCSGSSDGNSVGDDFSRAPIEGVDGAPGILSATIELYINPPCTSGCDATVAFSFIDDGGPENVTSALSVYEDASASGAPRVAQEKETPGRFDVFGISSNTSEEVRQENLAILQAIEAEDYWPAEVSMTDSDGNLTTAKILLAVSITSI